MEELYTNDIDKIVNSIIEHKIEILDRLSDIELGKRMIKATGANMNSYNHLFSLFNDPSISKILNWEFVDEKGYDSITDGKKISIKAISSLMLVRKRTTESIILVHTFGNKDTSIMESINNNVSDYVLLVQSNNPYSIGITTYNLAKENIWIAGPYAKTKIPEEYIRWIFKDEYVDKKEIKNKFFEETIRRIIKLTSGDWSE